jgi:hypothetical protein
MSYLRLLRQTIRELDVSDADMEKGTLRADVNVSVRRAGEEELRPRWEIKNMNSFRFIGRAIEAAFRQQVAAHEAGEEVAQSTYDYDDHTDQLTVHRSKEEADDYRYFPEPDLVPVEPPADLVERLRGQVVERPGDRIRRLSDELGFAAADELVITGNEWKAEALAAEGLDWKTAAAVAMNRGDFLPENAPALARIVQANVTREALDEAFAAAAEGLIEADGYLSRTALGDEDAPRPGDRRGHCGAPGAGGDLPRRQGGGARLLRRPGDARDAGQRPTRRSSTSCCGRSFEARQVADRVAQRADDRSDHHRRGQHAIATCGEVWASRSPATSGPSGADAARSVLAAAMARPSRRSGISRYEYAWIAESVFGNQNACNETQTAST